MKGSSFDKDINMHLFEFLTADKNFESYFRKVIA